MGDGPEMGPARALAAELGIAQRVALTAAVRRDPIPRLLAAAGIGVTCSGTESFGISTIEAVACARPVVGTAAGATPEIVRDGVTGLQVPHNDSAALGSALALLAATQPGAPLADQASIPWKECQSRANLHDELRLPA